jgi:hypothetical protein
MGLVYSPGRKGEKRYDEVAMKNGKGGCCELNIDSIGRERGTVE